MTDLDIKAITTARAEEIYFFYQKIGQTKILDRGVWRDRTAEDDWYQAEREIRMESEWLTV